MTKKNSKLLEFSLFVVGSLLCWILVVYDAIALIKNTGEWWEIVDFITELALGLVLLVFMIKAAQKMGK